ncbi:unnamed protein product, partial [Symbiodinium microadriaticum]
MASGSLAYRPHQDLDTDLTKFGFLVYAGTVRDFHEWEFRAMTRWKQTKVDERSELASKFLDSLRSEAYIIAEDLGADILFSNDNIPKVVEAVGGMLSRQPGGPMVSYIDRRKRWLRKLLQLVKATHIREAVLTDLLLENPGLNRNERLMVLTSMGGSTATKDAEKALIKMHSRIHTLERRTPGTKGDRGKGKGHPFRGGKGKGKGYGNWSQKATSYTYLSAVEDLFDSYQDDAEDGTAFVADEGEQDDWVYHGDEGPVDEAYDDTELVAQTADASLRDVELDVFTSFLCSEGFDENDRESLAFLADVVQSDSVAFMARSKGKPVSTKGDKAPEHLQDVRSKGPLVRRGTPSLSDSESESQSFEPEAAANYVAPSTEWDTVQYPDGSEQLFRFFMHKGSTYLEVVQNHPDYYHWGLKEKEPSTMLEAWVYRNFNVPPVGGGGPTFRVVIGGHSREGEKSGDLGQGLSEQVLNSPLKVQNLTRRQLEEYTFTKFEAGDVVKHARLRTVPLVEGPRAWRRRHPAERAVVADGGREKFAGKAIGEKDDPSGDITLDLAAGAAEGAQQGDDPLGDISPKSNASSDSELAAPLEEEIAKPRLPLVDPFQDHENVSGLCWTRAATRRAMEQGGDDTAKGIGAAKAVGKYVMPFALQISPETGSKRRSTRLQGELSSTELDSPDVLCLLSMQDQVQLGLVKDLRRGVCQISGYAGNLQLARHSKTGLLLQERRTVSIPCRDEKASIPLRDESVSAYMLSELVREQESQQKKVLLVTLGLEKLEFSHRSRKVYNGLAKLIEGSPKQKSYTFSLNEKRHEDILLESHRTNFSRFQDFTDNQIVFLDCRDMRDPDKDKSTRDRLGTHPKNLHDMILNPRKNHKWMAFAEEVIPAVHKLIQDQDSSVIFAFCKSGRHRSVANAKLFQEIIKDLYNVEAEIIHLSDGPNWRHLCGICDLCNWRDPEAQRVANEVIDKATEKWHDFVPKVSVCDFRQQLAPLDEKDLEKACFLVLSRVYSVFSPAKLTEVTSLMALYTDHVSLICSVTHKYLTYEAALALVTSLVTDLRSGARTEKDWHVDLELANCSLDQAILQLDSDVKDMPGDPAGDPTAQAADQAQPIDVDQTAGGSSNDRPPQRDRTRSAQPDRSKGKGQGKWKDKRASSRVPGPQTHTTSNPAETQHAEASKWVFCGERESRYMLMFLVTPGGGFLQNTHDDLLMSALGLPSVTTTGEAPTVFVLANAEVQPGSLQRGDLGIGTFSQAIGEVVSSWANQVNHTVSVDVLETADYTGHKCSWLNNVDVGTSYQVVSLVRMGGGQP